MSLRERVRRVTTFTIFALCSAITLAGCANTILPPTERAAVRHPAAHTTDVTELASLADDSGTVPAPAGAAPAMFADAQALAGNVERSADEIAALRRAITSCVLALFALGAVIAVLLAAILRAACGLRADAAQRAAAAGAALVARETDRALARRAAAPAPAAAPRQQHSARRQPPRKRRVCAPRSRLSSVFALSARTAPLISRKAARPRRRAQVKVAQC